jgi:cytochrome c peroxidase
MRTRLAAVVVLLAVGCSTEVGESGQAARVVPVAALGRMLFFDRALSADGQVSCATCHQPERAYSDGVALASGVAGQNGTRNTPSLLDAGRQRSLFWDGRRTRLEDQALDPLLSPVEHGLRDPAELLARLRSDARYTVPVLLACGIPIGQLTVRQVAQALAAFERTLSSTSSPFDRFLAGQPDAMSESARQCWVVFDQEVGCTRCHVVAGDGKPALFTDHGFHSLAVGFRQVERKLPELAERLVALQSSECRTRCPIGAGCTA